MEKENGNKFLNGFLLGVLIGAGIVFVLNTRKGKKLLKLISEDGLDNLLERLRSEGESLLQDDFEGDIPETPTEVKSGLNEVERKPIIVRRFFRGAGKKN